MSSNSKQLSYSRVLFVTDIISTSRNHEERNYTDLFSSQLDTGATNEQPNNLRETDKNKEIKAITSLTKTHSENKKATASFNSVSTLIKHICNAIGSKHNHYTFEIMNNEAEDAPDTPNLIRCRLQVQVHKNNNAFNSNEIIDLQEDVISIFDEINKLIALINDSVDDLNINSVILCKNPDNYINPIVYIDEGASRFTHGLFNSRSNIAKLALTFRIGSQQIKLVHPKLQAQNIFFQKTSMVIGEILHESTKTRSFRLTGCYLDNNSPSQHEFNSLVYCLDEGNTDTADKLFMELSRLQKNTVIAASIRPIQPFVCHEGVKAKKIQILSFRIIQNELFP